jgi:hypothetical protein
MAHARIASSEWVLFAKGAKMKPTKSKKSGKKSAKKGSTRAINMGTVAREVQKVIKGGATKKK